MRKRTWIAAAVGMVALLVAGGIYASNMGFKLNYVLDGKGTNASKSGTSKIALPYNQQVGLTDASSLVLDVNATPGAPANAVVSLSKFNKATNGLTTYTGPPAAGGTNFALVAGEGYQIQLRSPALDNSSVQYIIVGSHNPGLAITLDGKGTNGSKTGTNDFAPPYHTTLTDASGLVGEINAASGSPNAVVSVSQFNKVTNGLNTYTGPPAAGGTNFALKAGESYLVQLRSPGLDNSSVTFVPSHY